MGKRMFKAAYFSAALSIVLTAGMLTGCEKEVTDDSQEIYGYTQDKTEYTMENDSLIFTMDPATTGFSLTQKSTGHVWYSNPQGADEDSIANQTMKGELKSTLFVQYGTETGTADIYDSYTYSVANGLYKIDELEDGSIKVDYSIGNIERVYVMPIALPESKFLTYYNRMDSGAQKKINQYYRKYDINNLRSTDDKASLLETYPTLADEPMYVLRDGLQEYLKVKIEGFFKDAGYTMEDYEADLSYAGEKSSDEAVFDVSVIYKLDGSSLAVSVPFDQITYDSDYPITMIKILPFFGAAGTSDSGYILVPDGTGGVINFNNGKTTQNTYYSNMYGWDWATDRKALVNETASAFPCFGISDDDSSFLCIIDKGSAYSQIEADVAGRYNSYNYVNAGYNVIHEESLNVSEKSNNAVVVYEKKLPEGSISQIYKFLDTTDYSDMAETYRNYLTQKYPEMSKNTDETSLPMAVELVGAIEKKKNVLGIPKDVSVKLTGYKDASNIINELSESIGNNLSVRYSGWFNSGLVHDVPTDISLINALGGSQAFKKLVKTAEADGVTLYFDSNVEFAFNNSVLDGFYPNRDAAKFASRELAEIYRYDPVWYGQDKEADTYYLVKPSYSMKLINNIADTLNGRYGVKNLSFNDLGSILSGDYNPKDRVTRQEVLESQNAKLLELSEGGSRIMIEGGNDYAAVYADMIVNMNFGEKDYGIIDEQVPFYTMALHGLVDYTAESYNLSEDASETLLKSIENGAGLYFVLTQENSELVQESDFTYLFGCDYSSWKNDIVSLYTKLNADLGYLAGEYMTGHEFVSDKVSCTTYEDGTKVYVNFNYSDYAGTGFTVGARSYYIKKGGE